MAEKDLKALIEEALQSYDPTIDLSPGSAAQTKIVSRILTYVGQDPFLTDFPAFAQARIAEKYPQLAKEAGDPLNELLVTPTTAILEPLAREIYQIRLRQGARNLDYHTEESMDDLASNMFTDRNEGYYARGTVRLYFTSPRYVAATLDKTFYTADNLNYSPAADQYITASQMTYNKEGDYYYFDVRVVAQYQGDEYNVAANKIVGVVGIEGTEKVINKYKFSQGAARESNLELYSRVRNLPNEIAPNTYRGIVHIIREGFPSITYLQMIGYGDEEMDRDKIVGGSYGEIQAYGTAFVVEDGDYDGMSDVIQANINFYTIFGSYGTPTISAALTIATTTPSVLDYPITEIVANNQVRIDTELAQSTTISYVHLRFNYITLSETPYHAYPAELTTTQEFPDNAHIGACIDVWARDPQPDESEITLPTISDETYVASGNSASVTYTTDDDAIFIYDASSTTYYNGLHASGIVTIPLINMVLGDMGSGNAPIPSAMKVGDLIYINSSGKYCKIVSIYPDFPFIGVTGLNVSPSAHGASDSAYSLLTYTDGISKGWAVKLTSGESGVYKILKPENDADASFVPSLKLIVQHVFSTSGSSIPWKIYDNFEINLTESKDIKVEDNDLLCFLGSYVVESSTPLNFQNLGVVKNDILRINNGPNAGDYVVEEVLGASSNKIRIATPTPYSSGAGTDYTIFTGLGGLSFPLLQVSSVNVVDTANTNIPVPCKDILTCISKGIGNLGAGSRMIVQGANVGLVANIEKPTDDFALTGLYLNIKILRKVFLSIQDVDLAELFTVTFTEGRTLEEVISDINTVLGRDLAVNIDDRLGFRSIVDEAVLVENVSAASVLGFTTSTCCMSPDGHEGWFASYGVNLMGVDRPSVMGKNDYLYFTQGTNVDRMFSWEEIPTTPTDVIFVPKYSDINPQGYWTTSEVTIGYPSTGYFRLYFKEPTKLLIDGNSVITLTDENDVSRTYIPDPNKYALIHPSYPDITKPIIAEIINIIVVEKFLLYDGETGGGFSIGNIVEGANSGARGEVVEVTSWTGAGVLHLGAIVGEFENDENLQVSASTKGVANGTLGDVYLEYDNESGTFVVTNTITGGTSGAQATLVGLQDDGPSGKMCLEAINFLAFIDDEQIANNGTTADADGNSVFATGGDSIPTGVLSLPTDMGLTITKLLPKELGDSETNPYATDTDAIKFFYRKIWFYQEVNTTIDLSDTANAWMKLSVDNGPVTKIDFSQMTGASTATAEMIAAYINETFEDIAFVETYTGPHKYIYLNTQYLISNIELGSTVVTELGPMVPNQTTNKSLNYNNTAYIVKVYNDDDNIFYYGYCVEEGVSGGSDCALESGVSGDTEIQFEIRRYGAQLVSSDEMNDNTHLGYYYADIDFISVGVGDMFNSEAEEVGEINISQALGYTLTTTEPLSFSPAESLRMLLTTTISETDANVSAEYDTLLVDDLKIAFDYSEIVGEMHSTLNVDTERVLGASVVGKQMLPYYVNTIINYTGGPSETVALEAMTELINGLRARERIEVSDLVQILVSRGSTYVQLPIMLAILGQDTTRKMKLYLVEDTSTLSRLAAFYVGTITPNRS